jgi:UDP-2,3-diacylglucosamine hydrolase
MTGPSHSFQRIWIFSDLHLADPASSLYREFLQALDEPSSETDAVVFAGDIFEIFVGNSAYFTRKHSSFFEVIRRLVERKVSLFYIQGNHDFYLENAFAGIPMKMVDSELVLGRMYIAHGDLVDSTDSGYLRMRSLFRSAGFRQFVDLLPGKAVEWIGESISRSHERKELDLPIDPGKAPAIRPVFRKFAEEKKRQGFDFVILGHCHDLDDLQPFYFNMGYPPVHRQFLYWSAESNSVKRRNFAGN